VRIVEIEPIRWLLERGAIVICAGGGGIPVMVDGDKELAGVEAVIDKDFASELLAEAIEADLFVKATDVDGVYLDWGRPEQRRLDRVTPEELGTYSFPGGSMGPKVRAATKFARSTGRRASIGALADITRIVTGQAGTSVSISGG
jgi:carbamate kinase